MKGGLNTYGYAGVNPIVYIDRLGLVTSVITVRDFGFGVHSAVHVDNGTDGLPILYDPSGSYTPSSGEPVGSGEMLFNENANLQDYIKFHEQLENTTVEVTKLPTTPKQERDIAKRAENLGGSPLGGFCTLQTSVAIGGVCGIGLSFFPSSLAKDAANAECK
ncbi:hypothetical protein SPBRAN_1627 [uncultured Candidatus Thioglobus sp.]|nr:hypothetical protein SPBRAN_1627 [uncultured Candidatus Thioglobus sp.]